MPEQQSAYRRCHSTETAMLKVLSDAYVAADAGYVTLLSLLDLSSAFDTVDHHNYGQFTNTMSSCKRLQRDRATPKV